MLSYLTDKWVALRLRARYERTVREQLLQLAERERNQPVSEEPGGWQLVGDGRGGSNWGERTDERRDARRAVQENPHARNVLRLLEAYVVGEGFRLTFANANDEAGEARRDLCDRLWQAFLTENETHFSYTEAARRVWRDGECFLRIYPQASWPPEVRFVDPEWISGPLGEPDSDGIETEPGDVEQPRFYLKVDPRTGNLLERIPAEEMLHIKYGVDSNEKRGRSFFQSILKPLETFQQWQETELRARKLQSSIVLWRRVQGGPSQALAVAEGAAESGVGNGRQERIRPGTILTTSTGTDIKYLQPDTNFGDAVPLGRMILLGIAAGAGIPEFMLTSNAANGNYASTMVAEGPAVKLFQSEQAFFARAFARLWRRLMAEAVAVNVVSEPDIAAVELRWSFPQLVSRDRPREREADVRLIETGVLSRAEVQRREQLDPRAMQAEVTAERDVYPSGAARPE